MTSDPKKKPPVKTRLERLLGAAREEMPRAAYSGLTTSLIAGAQPTNAMADRRIYQPPLASMSAMNPEGDPGIFNAMQDVASDPRRMLPGSGGWTEGVGAALPHVAAASVDLINPAAWAAGGVAKNVIAESANGLSKMHLPPVPFKRTVGEAEAPTNAMIPRPHPSPLPGGGHPNLDTLSREQLRARWDELGGLVAQAGEKYTAAMDKRKVAGAMHRADRDDVYSDARHTFLINERNEARDEYHALNAERTRIGKQLFYGGNQ